MPSEALYLVTLVRTNVSENISPPFSGFLRLIGLLSILPPCGTLKMEAISSPKCQF
jgi:hypothetical protein